jgi:NACHT conflict system protein
MSGAPYTFQTARDLLLGRSSAAVRELDKILGVTILAAGPIGLISGHPWLLSAWGWVDQKSELISRLNDVALLGKRNLKGATGRQRNDLLVAAHVAIVIAAYFGALRDVMGPTYERIELTDRERHRLLNGRSDAEPYRTAVEQLFQYEISLPWAGQGFVENTQREIRSFYESLTNRCVAFFAGLAVWPKEFSSKVESGVIQRKINDEAVRRYQSEYVLLAAEVPEFAIWTALGEHESTHSSLARLEELISAFDIERRSSAHHSLAVMASINRTILTEPMADIGDSNELTAVRFPRVEDGYIDPDFRWSIVTPASRTASETWWRSQPKRNDLATFLAAHFASPSSSTLPLVILGHPGAGKSLLTRVCAARLSSSEAFVAVRISLRDVRDPLGSVYSQIQEALALNTHGRVDWPQLCDESQDRTRVILIDGLDELMQATGATESRYLRNVIDFQRVEAGAGGPVAVVVTSRTVVADLANIPVGCVVIKLEDFNDEQVMDWVNRWNDSNRSQIQQGAVRHVDDHAMLRYGEIVRQPLLLLLLAMAASERELPPDQNSAQLYHDLLDDFVKRELSRPDTDAGRTPEEIRRQAELWKLSLVAFGMLNRGQHFLHENQLIDDIGALPGPGELPRSKPFREIGRAISPARRVIGRFFFVHTSEADGGVSENRSYEFLHATFADYLIARQVVIQIRDLHTSYSRPMSQRWDDDLLFALLSHRYLAGGGSRTLHFFAEEAGVDPGIPWVLERLLGAAQERWEQGRFVTYDPSRSTYIERMAVYTANLASLRMAVSSDTVQLDWLCPTGYDTDEWWARQVSLWEAGLSESDLLLLTSNFKLRRVNPPELARGGTRGDIRIRLLSLRGDIEGAIALSAGLSVVTKSGVSFPLGDSKLADDQLASLLSDWLIAGGYEVPLLEKLLSRRTEEFSHPLTRLVLACVERCAAALRYEFVRGVVNDAIRGRSPEEAVDLNADFRIVASIVAQQPQLLDDIPALTNYIVNNLSRSRRDVGAVTISLASHIRDEQSNYLRDIVALLGGPRRRMSDEEKILLKLPPALARLLITRFSSYSNESE